MAVAQSQAYVKKKNILMVLSLIAQEQSISRTQIAEMTELSPASVTRIVNALIALCLVCEVGRAKNTGRGRRAHFLQTRADGLYTVSFCIESHTVLLCIRDFHHRSVWQSERLLDKAHSNQPEHFAQIARELLAEVKREVIPDWSRVRAAGVSIAGLVDNQQGTVLYSDQLEWTNVDLRTCFEQVLGLPVWIENDAKACLIGEHSRQSPPQHEEIAYLLIGTGIGVAATCAGQVLRGCNNRAGEIEHLNLLPSLAQKDTPQEHLVEENILESVSAVSSLIPDIDGLVEAYRQNLTFARLQIEDFERYLQLLISMIFCFYDPARIYLGGSTILKLAPLLDSLWNDPRLSLGSDYDASCLLGASIGAESYALDLLLNEG